MKCSKDAFWKCLKRYISKTIIVLTILFLFKALDSAISGIISVENDAKKIEGKLSIGITIPFIIPNIAKEYEDEEPYCLSAFGISISSAVLKDVCT